MLLLEYGGHKMKKYSLEEMADLLRKFRNELVLMRSDRDMNTAPYQALSVRVDWVNGLISDTLTYTLGDFNEKLWAQTILEEEIILRIYKSTVLRKLIKLEASE